MAMIKYEVLRAEKLKIRGTYDTTRKSLLIKNLETGEKTQITVGDTTGFYKVGMIVLMKISRFWDGKLFVSEAEALSSESFCFAQREELEKVCVQDVAKSSPARL